jgi:DNA repair protein RecN (Recombination protein N)
MLTSLNIQGLAIIESLAIDFGRGFNVITGETGAGKSILIKALGFLLGAKATAEHVRSGRDAATVTGQFLVPRTHRAIAVLDRLGIPVEDLGDEQKTRLIIRRQITSRGRSQAWLNDVPVTLTAMKELSEALVDVFAQHEHQRILDPVEHLGFVDQFITDRRVIQDYAAIWDRVQDIMRDLSKAADTFRNGHRDLDYLQFRIKELREFSPSPEDFSATSDRCSRADKLLRISGAIQKIQQLLDEGAGGDPLTKTLREASRILTTLSKSEESAATLALEAANIAERLDELSMAVGRLSSGGDLDERDLEAAQERLAGYQSLLRKTGAHDISALMSEWDRLAGELDFIESAATRAGELLEKLGNELVLLAEQASKLGQARQKAAQIVTRKIEAELKELAMAGASLVVSFDDVKRPPSSVDMAGFGEGHVSVWNELSQTLSGFGPDGAESAHFLLAANPGEPPMPLEKIASGGEVSRIMLALKRALAAGADTCILVFDEIDTGISGRVADIVGKKLAELAKNFQVICISHLPQVAAYAETHFKVAKTTRGSRTESTIVSLSPKESTEEIARLLSGTDVTPSSIANAKQLITRARSH